MEKTYRNKIKPKKYVLEILELYPQISSGRKNILQYEERLNLTGNNTQVARALRNEKKKQFH